LGPKQAFPFVRETPGEDSTQAPRVVSSVEYDAKERRFRVPLVFGPKWKGWFALAGFRSAQGIFAEPVKLKYQPGAEEMGRAERDRYESGAKDPELLKVLGSMQGRRAQLTSVVERVQTLNLQQQDGLLNSMDSTASEFKWRKPDRYFADVSALMPVPAFKIGLDGRNWWWELQTERTNMLVHCPTGEMQELNISICDPFGLTHQTSEEAANILRLRYDGIRRGWDKTFHVIQNWNVQKLGAWRPYVSRKEWLIDAATLALAEMTEFNDSGIIRTLFVYDKVNEEISESSFASPSIAGLSPSPPEELDEGYTKRFVNVRDGSNGQMSVRWGKKGTKGTSSSGLN
jgi:hypothetical protein